MTLRSRAGRLVAGLACLAACAGCRPDRASSGATPSPTPIRPAPPPWKVSPPATPDPGGIALRTADVAPMKFRRSRHTATVLGDGRVLVAGGSASGAAEVWDPSTRGWTAAGSLAQPRSAHTATLLADGRVLFTGGFAAGGALLATAEIFDPASGSFSTTGSLSGARASHSATLLDDGRVLAVGGLDGVTPHSNHADAQLWDPKTGRWSPAGTLPGTGGRSRHRGVRLSNGVVLVIGGLMADADAFSPATGTWTREPMLWSGLVSDHATVSLPDGTLVSTAGEARDEVEWVRVRQPDGTWKGLPDLRHRRARHTATLVGNGHILVAGGDALIGGTLATIEVYDSTRRKWTVRSMRAPRTRHAAVALGDASVLLIGGDGREGAQSSVEQWGEDPAPR